MTELVPAVTVPAVFNLTDAEGNRLIFVQWAVDSVFESHCR